MESILKHPTRYMLSFQAASLIIYRDIVLWQIIMWFLVVPVVYHKETSPNAFSTFVAYEVGPIIYYTSTPTFTLKYIPVILLWLPFSHVASKIFLDSNLSRVLAASVIATLLRFNFYIGTFVFRLTYYSIFFSILQLTAIFGQRKNVAVALPYDPSA